MASKQSLLVLAAVAACLLLLPAASVATDVDYCSEYPTPGTPRSVWALESRRFSRRVMESSASDLPLLWCAGRGKKYPVKVSGVEIVPDPVQPGKPATFKISASTGMAD